MRKGFIVIVVVMAGMVWQYIDHLGEGIKKETIIVYPAAMEDLHYEKSSALSRLNAIREAMGMNTLIANDALGKAAQNHADYLVANHEKNHFEIEGHQRFTGVSPLSRVLYTHYDTRQVSENLSTSHESGRASIDGLFSAIYHRFGFLDISIDEIGVGVAQSLSDSRNSAFVYNMGNSLIGDLCRGKGFSGVGRYAYKVCSEEKHRVGLEALKRAQNYHQKQNPKIILYPYDGQTEVPPAFYAEEPDPLPDMEVSGFPVSISFNHYHIDAVKLHTFKLFHVETNREVPARLMDQMNDPHKRFTANEFTLFPLERLAYNSHYRAEISYESKQQTIRKVWSFQTVEITEDLYVVRERKETIELRSDRSSVLYFKPLDSHDMLRDIRYPQEISLIFLDNHTIRLSFLFGAKRDFVIKAGDREVTVHVIPNPNPIIYPKEHPRKHLQNI